MCAMKSALRYDWEDGDATARWVASKIAGCERGWGEFVALRVMRGGIVGGVVYHDWNPEAGTMQMSAAGHDWLSRRVLYAMHAYPFEVAGCQMVALQTREDNTVMRRIAKVYGYTETIIPRLMGRDQNAAILTLTDDAWKGSSHYRSSTHGQAIRAEAA